jgi:hypothetical protein
MQQSSSVMRAAQQRTYLRKPIDHRVKLKTEPNTQTKELQPYYGMQYSSSVVPNIRTADQNSSMQTIIT